MHGRLGGFLARAVAVLLVATVGGCLPYLHDPSYPEAWSGRAPSVGADCSGLSGSYENVGLTTRMWHPIGERRLSDWLCAVANPDGRGARPPACVKDAPVTRVRLAVDHEHLGADLVDEADRTDHVELSRSFAAVCDGKRLTLTATFVPRCGGCVVVSHAFAELYRGVDDSLVLHDGDTSAGSVMLIFTAAGYEADWARFAAAEPVRPADLKPWPPVEKWFAHATWFGGPDGADVVLWHPLEAPPQGVLWITDQALVFRISRGEAWRRDIREVAAEAPAALAATAGAAAEEPFSLFPPAYPPQRPLPLVVVRLTLQSGRRIAIDAGRVDDTREAAERIHAHLVPPPAPASAEATLPQ